MEKRYQLRIFILTALVLVGFGTLVSRLYDYQIANRARFLKQVPSNYTITIREPGIRGDITDRNGIVLATNVRNYEVVFNLKDIRNDYRRHLKDTHGKEADEIFAKKKTHEIINEWVRPRLAIHNLDKQYNANSLNTHYITHGGQVPFKFRSDLSYDQFAYFAEHNLELPGVEIRVSPVREYPYGSLASHVLGYTKDWEKGKITEKERRQFKHYTGDSVGIAGVESTMDQYLNGAKGITTLLKNEKGKAIKIVDKIDPDAGSRVVLTIDARVQHLVETTLREVGRAAAVVMDPNTGKVLAMASIPDYTPNFFSGGITTTRYNNYRNNKAAPLLNKAIGNFTPGSTFKIATAIAASIHGHGDDHEHCSGSVLYKDYNNPIPCWNKSGHGKLDVKAAIQKSCNPYFMNIANEIGPTKMLKTFNMLGLGKKTGIELPYESSGFIPGDLRWKRNHPNKFVMPSVTAMMSIGQSESAASPLQLASLVSAVANGGKYYRPRIVKQVINPHQGALVNDQPELILDLLDKGVHAEHLENIRTGMWMAANKSGGTAKHASISGRNVAAKTGTAQVFDHGIKSHDAWTVAFAPLDQPKYVVVVAVKQGTSGGKVAGPLTHRILKGLFDYEEGTQLALSRMSEFRGDFKVRDEVILTDNSNPYQADTGGAGETGNEVPVLVKPNRTPVTFIPLPTIREEADAEGSATPQTNTQQ